MHKRNDRDEQAVLDTIRTMLARPFERPASRFGRSGWLVLTLVIGLLAGAVGGLTGLALVGPQPVASMGITLREPRATGTARELPNLAPISAATIDVYQIPRESALPAELRAADRAGRGVALTSDGWIVTTIGALPAQRARRPVIATADHRLHDVARIAVDPSSDLVFLHVPTASAPVLPLRDGADAAVGLSLFAPSPDGGVHLATLRARTARAGAGDIRSSDAWESVLAFDTSAVLLAGTPVLDDDGAIAGIALGGDAALPIDAVATAMRALFADGNVTRNTLGVTYRDPDALVRADAVPTDGVVLARNGSAPLFTSTSPLAGMLTVGDTILAIGSDPVTSRRRIGELLQEYPLGAEVVVHALRSGTAVALPVRLAKASGSVVVADAP